MSFRCDTCNLNLNSTWQYEQHLTGKSHAKKLKKFTSGDPSTIPGQVPSIVGRKQINFVRPEGSQQGQEVPGADGQHPCVPKTAAASGDNVSLYCSLCMVKLNSKDQAQIHYAGTKHLKKLKVAGQHTGGATAAAGTAPPNGCHYCGFCNITVNSAQQMSLHREGAKHKRMVEGMKRHASEWDGSGPVAKRTAVDPTENIPQVSASEIIPFEECPKCAMAHRRLHKHYPTSVRTYLHQCIQYPPELPPLSKWQVFEKVPAGFVRLEWQLYICSSNPHNTYGFSAEDVMVAVV